MGSVWGQQLENRWGRKEAQWAMRSENGLERESGMEYHSGSLVGLWEQLLVLLEQVLETLGQVWAVGWVVVVVLELELEMEWEEVVLELGWVEPGNNHNCDETRPDGS
jgi:hypothetical protein